MGAVPKMAAKSERLRGRNRKCRSQKADSDTDTDSDADPEKNTIPELLFHARACAKGPWITAPKMKTKANRWDPIPHEKGGQMKNTFLKFWERQVGLAGGESDQPSEERP